MTRQEYMEQLKKYLKRLPKEDYENAIEYFSEYFDEAGPQKEQQVMKELGEPKEAARELLLNLLQESVENDQDIVEEKAAVQPEAASGGKKRSPGKIILLAILVLCASPVSLALLVGVLAVSARSGCYRYSSDLFSWYHQHRSDSWRYCDGWFRSNTGSEICGSSMYDDRRRISDGRDRDSCRCSYYIYL